MMKRVTKDGRQMRASPRLNSVTKRELAMGTLRQAKMMTRNKVCPVVSYKTT